VNSVTLPDRFSNLNQDGVPSDMADGRGTDAGGSCPFCDIVAGRSAAHVIAADDVAVAFLDRTPLFPGHVLIVPTRHLVTVTDLPPDLVGPYFERVQDAARAVQDGTSSAGTFVAMNNTVSQSVPHLHTHVVPRNRGDGLKGFFWPRHRYRDDAEMSEFAARLRAAWPSVPVLWEVTDPPVR